MTRPSAASVKALGTPELFGACIRTHTAQAEGHIHEGGALMRFIRRWTFNRRFRSLLARGVALDRAVLGGGRQSWR